MRIIQNEKHKTQSANYKKIGFISLFSLLSAVSTLMFAACSPKASQIRPEQSVPAASLDKIEVSEQDGRSLLTIRSTSAMQRNYTVVKNAEPPKVVVEIPNVEPDKFVGSIEVNDGTIARIETSRMDGNGTRLEAFLTTLVEHEVKVNDNALELYFVKGQKIAEAAEKAAEPEVESAAPAVEEQKIEKASKTLKIIDVKVKKLGRFTTAEIITDGEPTAYNVFSLKAPNRVVVDIANAREILSKKEIKVVSPQVKGVRLGRYDDKVRVVFDYKRAVREYDVVKGKDRIIIFFDRRPTVTVAKVTKPKEAEKVAEHAEVPKEEAPAEVKVEEKPATATEEKIEAGAEAPKEAAQAEAEVEEKPAPVQEKKAEAVPEMKAVEVAPREVREKKFTGQKVTLEFKDADLKNIFRIIAEVSGYNMIIDNAVTGKVTLRLVNVPWDQALNIILETNNLGMTKVGNVIRVLPLAALKKEDEEKLASLKAKEKLEDLVPKLIPVNYSKASDISAKLKGVMSDRGTVEVDDRTNTIIMRDTQKNVDEAVKLVASLDTPTRQVVIEARIVTASTRFSRDLGVQWGAGYAADAAHGNPTGYYFPNSYNVNAGGGGSFALNPPASGGVGGAGGVVGINFGSINNTLNLDLRLSALESQGWGKVISSPKIITLDNKEASIQQGVSIPFETTSASGTQTQFVDASLNLTVTPHVTGDGRLSMKIKASKNNPSQALRGAGGAPAIEKREATTEILVKDGETTVIGGIYEVDKGESETYTPFLGKIPILGWLFKSKSKTETKTELLIFITPRIVSEKPV